MLLETLDIKKNDIVIFSQNQFDSENNFKIIFKDDPEKKVRRINYNEVCSFVNEFTPKNLIVYRLLTNIQNFQIKLARYGIPIYINGFQELIYLDPIFALKELEEYQGDIHEELRFRIQQIGLTTLNRINNSINFAEIYNIDLMASEARNQNDRVFADALFMEIRTSGIIKKSEPEKPGIMQVLNANLVAEDKGFDYRSIHKMNYRDESNQTGKSKTDLKNFLEQNAKKKATGIFTDSPEINKLIAEREDQKVVLKIRKSE